MVEPGPQRPEDRLTSANGQSERKDRPDSPKSGPGATPRKDRTQRLTLSVSPCAAPSSPITVLLLGQSAHCHFREAHVPQTGPSPSTHLLPRLPAVLPTTVTWTAFLVHFYPSLSIASSDPPVTLPRHHLGCSAKPRSARRFLACEPVSPLCPLHPQPSRP